MKAKVWIIIVIAVLLLIILVQNTGPVTLNLFFWEITMPQILLLFFSIIIGLVIGCIIRLFSKKKRSMQRIDLLFRDGAKQFHLLIATFTYASFKSPTAFGLHWSLNKLSLCKIYFIHFFNLLSLHPYLNNHYTSPPRKGG